MNDDAELIIQLCTRIGMIMEDASPDALTIGSLSPEQRLDRLRQLGRAADQISALVRAAISLSD